MKPLLLTTIAMMAISGAAFVGGCASSSSQDASASGDSADSGEDELNATCKYPRRYAAVLHDADCSNVAATRGQWVSTPAFEDAPRGACIYSWEGEKGAHVDRATIASYVTDQIGVLTMMCGGAEDGIDYATVDVLPVMRFVPNGGSVGCDVCGLLNGGKLWVVIPPEQNLFGEIHVPLQNGRIGAFKLTDAPAAISARVLSITLPPPPDGTDYVSGPVKVF